MDQGDRPPGHRVAVVRAWGTSRAVPALDPRNRAGLINASGACTFSRASSVRSRPATTGRLPRITVTAAAACQSHRLDGNTVGAGKLESGGDCARQRPAELPPGPWMRGRHVRAGPSDRIGCRPSLGLVARAGRPGRLTVVSHQVGKCCTLIGLNTLGDARPARDRNRNSPTCARPWTSTCQPAAGTPTRRVVGGYVEGRSVRVAVEVVDFARTSGVRVLGMSKGMSWR